MSPKQVSKTSNAPDPVGPYNQAIKAGDFIYCSGQIAIDPALNQIIIYTTMVQNWFIFKISQ